MNLLESLGVIRHILNISYINERTENHWINVLGVFNKYLKGTVTRQFVSAISEKTHMSYLGKTKLV